MVLVAAVGGLLLALALVGIAGLALNQQVARVTGDALLNDVELEDEGDDLRAAVLEVRHQHRNVVFSERISSELIADFERSQRQLNEEIDELEGVRVRDPEVSSPDEIRAWAQRYYDDFRPSVELHGSDRTAFDEASALGLRRLDRLANIAARIDEYGEQQTEESLTAVERTTEASRLALLAILVGVVLVGCALAYAAVRMAGVLRALYAEGQETASKLAEANQAKADFLADASHELRTPLTVLRVNAEAGLQTKEGCSHEEVLRDILHESSRMSRLVEDLLFLSHSDSASLPLAPETVAVEPFVAELAGRAEVLAKERGAAFEADLGGEGRMRVDPARVEQAVLILVDNAAKYGPKGSPVTLRSATRSGELRLTVEDRGPGIPRGELPKIFERFYRADKARTRKQGGAGLGLPIAKTVVEAHDGRIEAESRPGKGTRMSLYLPLLTAGADDPVEHLASESRR
jgi:signal transduction histidine kinase